MTRALHVKLMKTNITQHILTLPRKVKPVIKPMVVNIYGDYLLVTSRSLVIEGECGYSHAFLCHQSTQSCWAAGAA